MRSISHDDIDHIFQLRSDRRVNEYLDRPVARTPDDARTFINTILSKPAQEKWIYWALEERSTKEFVGTACLWNFSDDRRIAEVGIEVLPSFQGKGFAYEAMEAIISYGFDTMNFKHLMGIVHKKNLVSEFLLEKLNFERLPGTSNRDSEIVFQLTKPK